MANEKFSEDFVIKEMRCNLGENDFGKVYPQGDVPDVSAIEKLLKKAGGKPKECDIDDFSQGGNGKAKPEFVLTFKRDPSTIIVIECKRSVNKHESENYNKPRDFAVDGALYYAKFLKERYNVVAIGVSGSKKDDCKVSTFYWQKGHDEFKELTKLNILLEPNNYLQYLKGEKISRQFSLEEIRQTAINMSNSLRVANQA